MARGAVQARSLRCHVTVRPRHRRRWLLAEAAVVPSGGVARATSAWTSSILCLRNSCSSRVENATSRLPARTAAKRLDVSGTLTCENGELHVEVERALTVSGSITCDQGVDALPGSGISIVAGADVTYSRDAQVETNGTFSAHTA